MHRGCEEHDLPFVPGLGRSSVTIMMRTGLFPLLRSRYTEQLPKPRALWICFKNHIVEALQKLGLRLPTLEEDMQETHLRQRVSAASPLHQVGVDAASQEDELPAPSPKRRRVRGKTSRDFLDL